MTEPRAFLQIAIPILYVYDQGFLPETPPGFDMNLLPVVSRALKEHAGTPKVTVVTGAPVPAEGLAGAHTQLALQVADLVRATPEAANLVLAEFIMENFDGEAVREHLGRLIQERERGLADAVSQFGQESAGDGSDDAPT